MGGDSCTPGCPDGKGLLHPLEEHVWRFCAAYVWGFCAAYVWRFCAAYVWGFCAAAQV